MIPKNMKPKRILDIEGGKSNNNKGDPGNSPEKIMDSFSKRYTKRMRIQPKSNGKSLQGFYMII